MEYRTGRGASTFRIPSSALDGQDLDQRACEKQKSSLFDKLRLNNGETEVEMLKDVRKKMVSATGDKASPGPHCLAQALSTFVFIAVKHFSEAVFGLDTE